MNSSVILSINSSSNFLSTFKRDSDCRNPVALYGSDVFIRYGCFLRLPVTTGPMFVLPVTNVNDGLMSVLMIVEGWICICLSGMM